MPRPPRLVQQGRFFGDVLTLGWVLPVAIAAGAGLGWLLDRVLGIFPILTIVFGLIGAVAGLRQIYRESEKISAGDGDEASSKEKGNP